MIITDGLWEELQSLISMGTWVSLNWFFDAFGNVGVFVIDL